MFLILIYDFFLSCFVAAGCSVTSAGGAARLLWLRCYLANQTPETTRVCTTFSYVFFKLFSSWFFGVTYFIYFFLFVLLWLLLLLWFWLLLWLPLLLRFDKYLNTIGCVGAVQVLSPRKVGATARTSGGQAICSVTSY